ncbi:hypothetical protein BH11PSE12_BH11PSE12_29260 [soil metagenome]
MNILCSPVQWLAAVCLLTLGLNNAAQAAHLSSVACGNIDLAYYENGALYYRHTDGSYAGIDKDVVEEVERRSGCHFNTMLDSRVRIWNRLSNNTLAMSVSGIATPEREQYARFIPYFVTRNYVLLHKGVAATTQTMGGFLENPALKVGVVKSFRHGVVYDEWLDKLRAQNRVYEASDFESVMRLFAIGRVDAVLALPTGWQALLKRENLVGKVAVKDWAPSERVVASLVVSRELVSPEIYALLEKTLQAMRDDGSLEEIFKRHISADLAKAMRYEDKKP